MAQLDARVRQLELPPWLREGTRTHIWEGVPACAGWAPCADWRRDRLCGQEHGASDRAASLPCCTEAPPLAVRIAAGRWAEGGACGASARFSVAGGAHAADGTYMYAEVASAYGRKSRLCAIYPMDDSLDRVDGRWAAPD
ncbi:hypothetical protein WOLCODRAFT_155937 [Wolfiporia cocos MD-104 SS10]|uniref:Uncharacterized protein n=1 Tax=Wolfiporia cocos (strain MD-104) TaxID=742152 RepID=A0A2H3IZV8_WOLCO|nr:hypothetical protein WOLCODRAFT_155937 [Wolfiporia cocos MD-104 SS10]